MKQIIMLWCLITLLTLSPIAYAEMCTTTLILCGDGTDDCNTITCYNNETNITGTTNFVYTKNIYSDDIRSLYGMNETIENVILIYNEPPKLSALDRIILWMNRIISPYLPESICPH